MRDAQTSYQTVYVLNPDEGGIRLELHSNHIKCHASIFGSLAQTLLYFVFRSCYHYKTCESLVVTGSSNCCE